MRFKSKADPNRTFLEYCDSGSAAVKLNRAKLDGARSILSAVLREFRAFGMPVPALAHVMEDELDSLADSAGLTTIEQQLLRKELDVYGQTVPGLMIPEPEPGTSDDAKVAKQSRAITVARLIRELNDLKPQMFEDESEYNRLRTLYPGFLTFRIAEERPDLKVKVLSIRGSTRHIRLAQELAAAHHGRALATIQDDWKDHKPAGFKRPK